LLAEIREIQIRYEHDSIIKSQGHPLYAPNTLDTSVYCVTHADAFENALERANKIETDYRPTLVGMLAGARWVVPQSIFDRSSDIQLKDRRQTAKCSINEWKKQSTLTNNSKKIIFSFSKLFS